MTKVYQLRSGQETDGTLKLSNLGENFIKGLLTQVWVQSRTFTRDGVMSGR